MKFRLICIQNCECFYIYKRNIYQCFDDLKTILVYQRFFLSLIYKHIICNSSFHRGKNIIFVICRQHCSSLHAANHRFICNETAQTVSGRDPNVCHHRSSVNHKKGIEPLSSCGVQLRVGANHNSKNSIRN